MKIITNNIKLPLLAFAAFATLFLGACKDDDDAQSDKVELLSFGPTGVKHGEEISIIGLNLNKVNAIEMAGATVTSDAFVEQKAELIILQVPLDAEEGPIRLLTETDTVESITVLSFEVPISITSITGEARPGANVTINGEFMNWVTEVWFADDLLVTEFISQTRTQLVVTVPETAKTGPIAISAGGTEPLTVETEVDLIVTLPDVTSLAPANIKHSGNLTLTGTDLDLVQEILFPGGTTIAKADFESQSATSLVVTVPNNALNGALTLTVASGLKVVTENEISIILPIVTEFSANSSPGVNFTITGTDLDLVEDVIFPVGLTVNTFVSQTATEIVVVIPDGAVGGTLKLKTIHDFIVTVELPFGDQSLLLYTIYDDSYQDNWQNWSWGGASAESTEQSLTGSKSVKKTYDGSWDGMQFGNGSVPLAGYDKISMAIYGGAGSDGKKINVVVNEAWGSPKEITIIEGTWTTFEVAWSEVGSPTAPLYRIGLQAQGWSGDIYIDKVGLK